MSFTYHYEELDDFNNSTIKSSLSISSFILDLSTACAKYRFILACFGIIVNIFHLLVLSRKSMRNNCINLIMMGIALFDLLNLGFDVYMNWTDFKKHPCSLPYTYSFTVIDFWITTISDIAHRLTTWLAFLMAFLRYIILKYYLNDKLSKPSFALKIMVLGLIVSSVMSLFYFGRFKLEEEEWVPPKRCNITTSFVEYQRVIRYDFLEFDAPVMRFFNITDGLLKLIPTCLFPVLTFLLIRQLREAENTRNKARKQEDPKKDHTTKLVVMMTITFIAAEGPFGIVYFFQEVVIKPKGLSDITQDLMELFEFFVVINATSHCFVCLIMSSEYRKAVRTIFCGTRKKSVTKLVGPN